MIRRYELMVLLQPEFDGQNDGKNEEAVKKLVGEGVTIKKVTSLGKKFLAYPIRKIKEAVYLLAELEASSLVSAQLEKRAKLEEQILRTMLTVKEG